MMLDTSGSPWQCRAVVRLLIVVVCFCSLGVQGAKVRVEPGGKAVGVSEPSGTVTLGDAVAYAMVNSPELKVYSIETRVAAAKSLKAGLLPNPELAIEFADFGGSEARKGLDSAETTVQLGQLIELSGKRRKRVVLAASEEAVAKRSYERARLDVMQDVHKAYVGVLRAQEELLLATELTDVSQNVYDAVARRVEAGKDPAFEQSKANIALGESRIELERAEDGLRSARSVLAGSWGSDEVNFENVSGRFYEASQAPAYEKLSKLLIGNAELMQLAQERISGKAAVDLARAQTTPDVTLGGGVRYFNDGDNAAFIVGLAIPLPVFDRNRSGVRQAKLRLAQAGQKSRAAEIRIKSQLYRDSLTLSRTAAEAKTLADEILPSAQEALDAVSKGYRDGKFDYLHVLDAQRTFFEMKSRVIDVLTSYHLSRADVEQLIGQSLDSLD